MDQPNKVLDAFEIIGGVMSVLEADDAKRKRVELNLPPPKKGGRNVSRSRRG